MKVELLAVQTLVALAVGVNVGYLIGLGAVSRSPSSHFDSPLVPSERPLLNEPYQRLVNQEDVEIAQMNEYVQTRAQ